jgi:hypothetical protein
MGNIQLSIYRTRRDTITALQLLRSGVSFNVIALWLWHKSTTITRRPTWQCKEKTLARLESPDSTMRRYRAPDSLMPFLQWLKLCKECAGS